MHPPRQRDQREAEERGAGAPGRGNHEQRREQQELGPDQVPGAGQQPGEERARLTRAELVPGSTVRLRVFLPGKERSPLLLEARVIRDQQLSDEEAGMWRRKLAIEFLLRLFRARDSAAVSTKAGF